jgi:hypothetical protein
LESNRTSRQQTQGDSIEHSGREATADVLSASLEGSIQPDATSVQRNAFRYLIAAA